MKKKIEQFLMGTLIVFALVLLIFTEARSATPAQTTAPTAETTAPAEEQSVSTESPQTTSNAMSRVTKALKAHPPAVTVTTYSSYDPELMATEDTMGSGQSAAAFALAQLCGEQRMNPIDAFWALAKEGIYDRSRDTSGVLKTPFFFAPLQEQRTYAFSVEGAKELLTDLLNIASGMRDSLPIEERILGENLKVEDDQIFQSAENCLCVYYVCYGDRSAHFLCFYLRGEENITDVSFQLMNLHYAAGDQDAVTDLDEAGDRQVVTLMTALELLMTGRSRAAKGDVPFAYELKDCSADITRYSLTGSGESGDLTCYHIHR